MVFPKLAEAFLIYTLRQTEEAADVAMRGTGVNDAFVFAIITADIVS